MIVKFETSQIRTSLPSLGKPTAWLRSIARQEGLGSYIVDVAVAAAMTAAIYPNLYLRNLDSVRFFHKGLLTGP